MSTLFTTRITAERLDRFGIPSFNQDLIIQFRARITCTDDVKQKIIDTFLGCVLTQLNHHYSSLQLNSKPTRQAISRHRKVFECAQLAKADFLDIARQYDVYPPLKI